LRMDYPPITSAMEEGRRRHEIMEEYLRRLPTVTETYNEARERYIAGKLTAAELDEVEDVIEELQEDEHIRKKE
jgi:hypothetical protein